MARKERNDVDYFPHSVTHGKKMFYLRDKYGNDGYAVWFMLLEQLGKAEYHYLDLKNEVQIMYLSSEFKVSESLLIDIINVLVKLEEFDNELWNEERILFNEKFIENVSDAYKKRNNNCIDKNSLLLLLSSKGRLKPSKSIPKEGLSNLKVSGNTQSKVKDSKVNKSIGNENEFSTLKKEEKIKSFKNSIKETNIYKSGKYPVDMFIHFTEYWTAETKSKKLFFETQKTFSFQARLRTWINNDQKYRDL